MGPLQDLTDSVADYLDPNILYEDRLRSGGFRTPHSIREADSAQQIADACGLRFGEANMIWKAARAGNVIFGVTSEQGEFSQYDLVLPTENNRVLLESLEKQLALHKPPLRVMTVNNVPATARPDDKTLAVEFSNGERLELVAQLASGYTYFDAYPKPFAGFAKGLQWSWNQT